MPTAVMSNGLKSIFGPSQNKGGLSLCWPEESRKLAQIDSCKGKADANFFLAVKYAIDHFTFPPDPFKFQPIKGTELQTKLATHKIIYSYW